MLLLNEFISLFVVVPSMPLYTGFRVYTYSATQDSWMVKSFRKSGKQIIDYVRTLQNWEHDYGIACCDLLDQVASIFKNFFTLLHQQN